MGIGASKPSEEDNIDRKRVLSTILRFMLENADLRDMYSLASMEQCKQYTIFTKITLDKYFKKLQLYPGLGEDGKFYFQRLSRLAQLPGEYKGQDTACMELSRFFVRILHIFASVSLTILDVDTPTTAEEFNSLYASGKPRHTRNSIASLGAIPFLSGRQQAQKSFWGIQPQQEYRIQQDNIENNPRNPRNYNENENNNNRGARRGGALPPTDRRYPQYKIVNDDYKILNRYLSFFDSYTFKFVNTEPYVITVPITSIFKEASLDEVDTLATGITLECSTTYARTNKFLKFSANLQIDRQETKYTATLNILEPRNKRGEIKEVFRSAVRNSEATANGLTLVGFLKRQLDEISGRLDNKISNATRRNKQTKLLENSTPGLHDYYKVKTIIESFKPSGIPIKAYCVARAVQLISPEPSNRTQICDKQFPLLGRSLPQDYIVSSRGILALDKLFYNKFKNTPTMSNSVKDEYSTFLKGMQALYKGTNIEADVPSIKNIHNIPHSTLCTGRSSKLYVKDNDVVSLLRAKANSLINIQNNHIPNAMAILNKLFIINGKQPIVLQPAVEEGGMEAVEAIAGEARTLLINYYTDCEIGYREGVDILADKVRATPTVIDTKI